MKKFFDDLKNDKIIHYILIFLAAAIAGMPLINLRIYGTDDGFIHILRIMGVDEILKNGTFPPYICSRYCDGFGYAINLFYPPLVTYGPLLFKMFTGHYYDCLKIYSFFTIFISGITMYKFVYEITKKREISVISAIIYIFIPYRLESIYNRFAIGEFSTFMFLPLLFLGLYNLLNGDGKKHYYIAISASLLMLTHTITTFYAALFSLLYILLNIKKINKTIIKKLAINLVFVLLITAFFSIPLIEHKLAGDYIILDSWKMHSTPDEVYESTVPIKYFFTGIMEKYDMDYKLGVPLIILILLGIPVLKKINKDYKNEYLIMLLIAVLSLLMTTKYFLWLYVPQFFTRLQFAWRMLTFFEFAISIVTAVNLYTLIDLIPKQNLKDWMLLLSVILIIASMAKISYDYKYEKQKTLSDEKYEERMLNQQTIQHMQINREYLTDNTRNANMSLREKGIIVVEGSADIIEENKDNLTLSVKVTNIEKNTTLELPYLYYLGYEVKVNGNKINYFESNNGFIAVKIDEDMNQADITVSYTGTTLEKVSYVISILAFIGFIGYLINEKRKQNEKSN